MCRLQVVLLPISRLPCPRDLFVQQAKDMSSSSSSSRATLATACMAALLLSVQCPTGADAASVGPCPGGCRDGSRAVMQSLDKALAEWTEPLGYQLLAHFSDVLGSEHVPRQATHRPPPDTGSNPSAAPPPPPKTPSWQVVRESGQHDSRVLEVELPGVPEDGISLEVTTDKHHRCTLSLTATRPTNGPEYHQQWRLSSEVQTDGLEASMVDGLLRITLPDKPTPPAMKIAVGGRSAPAQVSAAAKTGSETDGRDESSPTIPSDV